MLMNLVPPELIGASRVASISICVVISATSDLISFKVSFEYLCKLPVVVFITFPIFIVPLYQIATLVGISRSQQRVHLLSRNVCPSTRLYAQHSAQTYHGKGHPPCTSWE